MEEEVSRRLAKKMLDFQIQWGQWHKNLSKHMFNINGKNNISLTVQQFIILMFIHKMNINTVSEMSCLLNLSKSSLSLTLSKMEQENLLKKTVWVEGDDGRKVYFSATKKGILALEERQKRVLEFFTEFCEGLSQEQKQDLETGIEKLSRVLK